MLPIHQESKKDDVPSISSRPIKDEPIDPLMTGEPTAETTFIKPEPIDQHFDRLEVMEQQNSTIKNEPCDTGTQTVPCDRVRKNVPFFFGKRKKVTPPPPVCDKKLPCDKLPEKIDDDDDDIIEITPPTPPAETQIENHNGLSGLQRGSNSKVDKVSFNCLQCSQSFPAKNLLSRHILYTHKKVELKKCPKCVCAFTNKNELLTHLGLHSEDPENPERYIGYYIPSQLNTISQNPLARLFWR